MMSSQPRSDNDRSPPRGGQLARSSVGPQSDPRPFPSSRRPWAPMVRSVVVGIGWSIIALLAALAMGQLLHYEPTTLLIALYDLTPLVYLPAYGVMAVALATRHWLLVSAATALIVLQLLWVVPEWWPIRAEPRPPADSPTVRLFDANISDANTDPTGLARQIEASHPDIVTLEEVTQGNMEALRVTHVLDRFPWRFIATGLGPSGIGVWSALPTDGLELWRADDHPEIRGWVTIASTRVRLYVFHDDAPVGDGGPGLWKHQLSDLRRALAVESRPLIVAGDFNATSYNGELHSILHLGLRDGAIERGQGWRMTWPANRALTPPVVRFDHVLVSAGIVVIGYRVGRGAGSDHRPIVADLAVPRSAPGA